ncbi:hypothetical protein FACS18948_6120 [Clostridia bacterium]|nr:hypothetical protein FACS18948_6120 [Clostridia bacterium]
MAGCHRIAWPDNVRQLAECEWITHYGRGFANRGGISVPLWNSVYHDCFLIPWSMGKSACGTPKDQLGFLHGMLNGGMEYLDAGLTGDELVQNIERCKTLSTLQMRVAHHEMISHEFVTLDRSVQRTVFADGTSVTVDFGNEQHAVSF